MSRRFILRWSLGVSMVLVGAVAARADSITIASATVVKKSIYADGVFVATSYLGDRWQVSTDKGKTWTDVAAAAEVFSLPKQTWSGNTVDLANGTYWLRMKLTTLNGDFYSNIMKDLKVPGPESCSPPSPFDEETPQFQLPPTFDPDCVPLFEARARTRSSSQM